MSERPGTQHADPPVREDGRCHVCLKRRRTDLSARYAPGLAEADPFCSTICARKYHGTSLPIIVGRGARSQQAAA